MTDCVRRHLLVRDKSVIVFAHDVQRELGFSLRARHIPRNTAYHLDRYLPLNCGRTDVVDVLGGDYIGARLCPPITVHLADCVGEHEALYRKTIRVVKCHHFIVLTGMSELGCDLGFVANLQVVIVLCVHILPCADEALGWTAPILLLLLLLDCTAWSHI